MKYTTPNMKHKIDTPDDIRLTTPFVVKVVLVDPKVGDELIVLDTVTLLPGDSVSWTYPKDGLPVTLS